MTSIKDVAREAGVSPSTVSSVINGLSIVKPTTVARVQDAISKLGYTPNIAARELVTQKKQNIGLILMVYAQYGSRKHTLEGGEEVLYENYINSIAQQISGTGYGLLIEYFTYVPGSSELPQIVRQKRVAGVIVAGSIYLQEFISLLKQEVNALVTIGCRSGQADYVANDYEESIRSAITYLAAQGHSRIAYVSGDKLTDAYPYKLQGYKRALEESGIAFREQFVQACRYFVSEGYRVTGELLALSADSRPTAILYASDILAAGAYRYCYEQRIGIPEDISIIGYENITPSVYMNPHLTTVEWHKDAMSRKACELLFNRIKEPEAPHVGVIIPCDLVIRESVRKMN